MVRTNSEETQHYNSAGDNLIRKMVRTNSEEMQEYNSAGENIVTNHGKYFFIINIGRKIKRYKKRLCSHEDCDVEEEIVRDKNGDIIVYYSIHTNNEAKAAETERFQMLHDP